jgi:hypothetical protein
MTFAVDALVDPNPVAHHHSVTVSFPIFGEVDTTDAIIAGLPVPA